MSVGSRTRPSRKCWFKRVAILGRYVARNWLAVVEPLSPEAYRGQEADGVRESANVLFTESGRDTVNPRFRDGFAA